MTSRPTLIATSGLALALLLAGSAIGFAQEAEMTPLAAPLATPGEPENTLGTAPRPTTAGFSDDFLPGFLTAGGPLDSPEPDLVVTIRGGIDISPAYLGSDEYELGPDIRPRLDYVRFPGGFEFGSSETVGFRTGPGVTGSIRVLRERDSSDYPEIAGLNDVDLSFEAGLGVEYQQRNYRAFADVRYGLVGHHTWVSDVGVDGIVYPVDGLTLTAGPRVLLGTDRFTDTYFGVSPEEADRADLAPFDAEGGVYAAGVEVTARYLFNERWGVEGIATWNRLLNDAADSPVTEQGSEDQYRFRLGITRRISLDF